MKVIPAQVTLNALREGQVMNELAQAFHDAMIAVEDHRKPADVTLSITFKPLGTKGVSDAVEVTAEVVTKLPKAPLPSTMFFRDVDGNPSRQRDRQPDFPGLGIAGAVAPSSAA